MDTTPATQPKPKSTLDTVANIAIIVVCVFAVFFLSLRIRDYFEARKAGGGQRPPEAAAGDQFDALRQVLPAGSDRTLVVAVAPTCHFCTESMPFYKRLLEERDQKGSKTRVIAAVPREDAKAEQKQKMDSAGVSPDDLVVVNFQDIKVPGTPTILLVNNEGKVLDVWVGKQDPSGEKKVLATL